MNKDLDLRSLNHEDAEAIVDCLVHAFSEYVVKMPSDVNYWKWRFCVARVDWNLSIGAFDGDLLVAFILIGVDALNGEKIAFNAGTGIRESYRGLRLVDQLYKKGQQYFTSAGITCHRLEVLTNNNRAIRVYERIGFQKKRKLLCFKHDNAREINQNRIDHIDLRMALSKMQKLEYFQSWDNLSQALMISPDRHAACHVSDESGRSIGIFIQNHVSGYVNQVMVELDDDEYWDILVSSLSHIKTPIIKINNVDIRRINFIQSLISKGWDNYLDQYEMEFKI